MLSEQMHYTNNPTEKLTNDSTGEVRKISAYGSQRSKCDRKLLLVYNDSSYNEMKGMPS